jgi:predicted Zn finger-like uncharacterized protein
VKFLCDRCKTRYSIGDDRVRGKILKIRCKTCENVITVREGMPLDGDAAPGDAAEPVRKPGTAATEAVDARAVAGRAANEPVTSRAAGRAANEPAAPGAAGRGGARDPLAGLTARRSTEVETVRGLSRGTARSGATPPPGEVHAAHAAVASAVASPAPAALEEEWYVSIDGEQAGPFSLAAAQRWVTQQPVDAELHCWSEGFDDWLPVDKVSHFRGLRKRPLAPSTPPPLPRATAAAPRPAPAEDEPKPLFAATMASLERDAPVMPTGLGLPPPAAAPAPSTPPRGTPLAARSERAIRSSNGAQGPATTPLGKRPDAKAEVKAAATPEGKPEARPEARIEARAEAPRGPAEARPARDRIEVRAEAPRAPAEARPARDRIEVRAEAPRAPAEARPAGKLGARDAPAPTSSSRPFADPFDPGQAGDDLAGNSDGKTVLEALPFDDAPVEPRLAPGASGESAADRGGTAPAAPAHAAPPRGDFGSDFGSDDDLDIGEVSRVVNMADVARGARAQDRPAVQRAPTAPAAATRSTGVESSLRPSARLAAPAASPAAVDGEPGVGSAPVVRAQRRGLIALLMVVIVLVLGVVGAVLFVTRSEDTPTTSLGTVQDIDTSRPDDPVGHHPVGSAGSAGSAAAPGPAVAPTAPPVTTRPRPRPTPGPGTGQIAEAPPAGNPLGGDEIEDVARKHQEMTQRCYMRSQRGADAILVGDVKKIAVTLTIDRDGNVSELQLSDHAADALGKCLTGAIRSWKFRPSAGGMFRFSLNFVNG